MELLSNGNSVKLSSENPTAGNPSASIPVTNRIFYSSFFKEPIWKNDSKEVTRPFLPSTDFSESSFKVDNQLYSNSPSNGESIGSVTSISPSTAVENPLLSGNLHRAVTSNVICGCCETYATKRCIDCNDLLCEDCVVIHQTLPATENHVLVKIARCLEDQPFKAHVNGINILSSHCETHDELFRYLCETCKMIICQECTFFTHKEPAHVCTPLKNIACNAKEKIQAIIESGKLGTKYIKASIDRAVSYSQAVERETNECSARIKKAMRHFILAAEDRERVLIEKVEKYRSQKLSALNDQMVGLREALSGLSQTSENLAKALEAIHMCTPYEIANTLVKGESEMEKFAAVYKSLQPKEEFISFSPPNFELLQEIRVQGDIVLSPHRGPAQVSTSGSLANISGALSRRSSLKGISKNSSNWELITNAVASMNISQQQSSNATGQCIPGSLQHIVAKPATGPSFTFGFEGHEDGQVSRPWGICTDKDGSIIVADRRNNRIQIFRPDGTFKLKFGSKGTNDGQFDLPAGISMDPQNRICVVDKDNHRVQVFSSTGAFIFKFGSYGKECGQFQYPWDIAVNSKGEMIITDSRNHRIQLFNSNGEFLTKFGFDGINHSRYLKGLTTPRGACFTPHGDVIVSDFENHRLLLIDAALTKVIATKGHEGSGTHEFSRPSGICCDDDGKVVVADSKNQRVIVFSRQLEFLWVIEIKPLTLNLIASGSDEKDRPSDIALLPDGRLVVMVETSPDTREQSTYKKTFIHIY